MTSLLSTAQCKCVHAFNLIELSIVNIHVLQTTISHTQIYIKRESASKMKNEQQ